MKNKIVSLGVEYNNMIQCETVRNRLSTVIP